MKSLFGWVRVQKPAQQKPWQAKIRADQNEGKKSRQKSQGIFGLVPKYDSHILFPLVSFKKFKKLTVVLAKKTAAKPIDSQNFQFLVCSDFGLANFGTQPGSPKCVGSFRRCIIELWTPIESQKFQVCSVWLGKFWNPTKQPKMCRQFSTLYELWTLFTHDLVQTYQLNTNLLLLFRGTHTKPITWKFLITLNILIRGARP